jgi:hypothetical protein
MRFDCEADRKAQDAGRYKSPLYEAPCSHYTKTYDHSSGVAGCKEDFAVGKSKAD